MAMTFRGGIHPPDSKNLTNERLIEKMPLPERVVIPLQQHIGAPAQPLVEKGDHVNKGQPLGSPGGFVSVPAHASISGEVEAVEERITPLGVKAVSIVIRGDGEDRWVDGLPENNSNWEDLSIDDLRNRIRDAGITGMGGAAFPTHVKLAPPPEKPIDCVILNGVECEPYATSDHRLMLERPDDILMGLRIFMKILGSKVGIVGIEGNKPDAINLLTGKVSDREDVRVTALKVKYPQGGEKQLIKALTNREVPVGGLPMDVGCLVQNVGTAVAVYEAITKGIPLIERVVTVTGLGIKKPSNLLARIGVPFRELINFCGGYSDGAGKLIMGGPMMGIAQFTDEVPVIKGASCILCLTKNEAKLDEPKPCILCGRCVSVCPINLMPRVLGMLVTRERWDELGGYGIDSCIECGCCSYVCPSKIHLVHLMKLGKDRLRAMKKKAS